MLFMLIAQYKVKINTFEKKNSVAFVGKKVCAFLCNFKNMENFWTIYVALDVFYLNCRHNLRHRIFAFLLVCVKFQK